MNVFTFHVETTKTFTNERKNLRSIMSCQTYLKTIDYDLDNSVFSFIPNTAESSFYGMIKGLEDHLNERKFNDILVAPRSQTYA